MAWIKLIVILLAGLAVVWVAAAAFGAWRWQGRTAGLLAELAAATLPQALQHHDPATIADLPLPVQRYFRAALTPGQPMVARLTLTHAGTFNMGEGGDSWKYFTSAQHVVTSRPGFVWDASIRMAPGLPVRVHDACIAGEGVLVPAILGLFPLMQMRGTGDIAAGALLRYLAETPWYPTALLPGQGVIWTAIDDNSARATLTDGAVTVSLRFRFGADGRIVSAKADARGRMVGGAIVATAWEGRWSDYRRQHGMMLPMSGEVAWLLPQGDKPYWRGRVTSLHIA